MCASIHAECQFKYADVCEQSQSHLRRGQRERVILHHILPERGEEEDNVHLGKRMRVRDVKRG